MEHAAEQRLHQAVVVQLTVVQLTTAQLTVEGTMAQLQRAIWVADRGPSQEVWLARSSARVVTDSSARHSQENPIQTYRVTPAIALQQRFDALVMCNFTPRSPSELPPWQWVSCN